MSPLTSLSAGGVVEHYGREEWEDDRPPFCAETCNGSTRAMAARATPIRFTSNPFNFAISCLTLIVNPEKGVSGMRIPTILKRRLSTLVLVLLASTLALAQYDDGQYQILQARYGTARSNVDVTERLRELAREDTTFRMGNSTFGIDPDRGVVKTLRI